MARKIRVEYPGAIYHVMARGNERARIFHGVEDHELFLSVLEAGLERFSVVVHAYCLMPNHFHLALETPKANLSRLMAWVLTTFTVRYNRKHKRSGHLFQGRYRAELVEEAKYGKWLAIYIHLNPVRSRRGGAIAYTGNIETLSGSRWSSHLAWLGEAKPEMKNLSLRWLGEWGSSLVKARKAYLFQISQEVSGEDALDWKLKVEKGLAVGGEAFVSQICLKLKNREKESGGRHFQKHEREIQARPLREELAREADVRFQMWIRIKLLGENQVALAKELGYAGSSGVCEALRRLERSEDKLIRCKLEALRKSVK